MNDIPVHDGSKFSWQGNEGSVDVSDLNPKAFGWVPEAQNMAFIVKSHKTGTEKVFYHADTERDDEGDVIMSRFYTSDGKFSVLVWND